MINVMHNSTSEERELKTKSPTCTSHQLQVRCSRLDEQSTLL